MKLLPQQYEADDHTRYSTSAEAEARDRWAVERNACLATVATFYDSQEVISDVFDWLWKNHQAWFEKDSGAPATGDKT